MERFMRKQMNKFETDRAAHLSWTPPATNRPSTRTSSRAHQPSAACSYRCSGVFAPDKQKHKLATRSISFSPGRCVSLSLAWQYHSRWFSFFSYSFARKHAVRTSEMAITKEWMSEKETEQVGGRKGGTEGERKEETVHRVRAYEWEKEREKLNDATRRKRGGTRREREKNASDTTREQRDKEREFPAPRKRRAADWLVMINRRRSRDDVSCVVVAAVTSSSELPLA